MLQRLNQGCLSSADDSADFREFRVGHQLRNSEQVVKVTKAPVNCKERNTQVHSGISTV